MQETAQARIIKLLELTSSDFDGEALNAIRVANSLLRKENKRWCDLITSTIAMPATDEKNLTIEDMLDFLEDLKLSSKTRAFVDSLANGYEKYGRLTEKQTEALEKIYRQEGGL